MPIEPVKIPQNVYIEDRIIGPLTLKQIIIVTVGCGFSYALWATASKAGIISLPLTVLVWIPGLLSFVFAFVKINDLSMLKLCLLMLERINKPSVRAWAPRRGITINIRTFNTATATNGNGPTLRAIQSKNTLHSTAEDHLDEISTALDASLEEEPVAEAIAAPVDTPVAAETQMRPVEKERISVTPLADNALMRDISTRA